MPRQFQFIAERNILAISFHLSYNLTTDRSLCDRRTDAQQEETAVVEEPPAPEENIATPVGEMVWLSATGEKYHSINNCGRMNPNKARQVTLEDAINSGYDRCSKFW